MSEADEVLRCRLYDARENYHHELQTLLASDLAVIARLQAAEREVRAVEDEILARCAQRVRAHLHKV